MRVKKEAERDAVLEIVKSGKIVIDSREHDIKNQLSIGKNIEYRREDIDKIEIKGKEKENVCNLVILPCGSGDVPFESGFTLNKVCILNFASSKNPGGGFLTGANAQEENLCYNSNLYKCLSKNMSFYEFNKLHLEKGLYTDGIIFTSDAAFFKKNYVNVIPRLTDVITCAAPNKGAALRNGVKSTDVDKVMTRRLEQILKVAIENNVDNLVLGAFGCGVFKNDIEYVALETKKLLYMKGYAKYFKNIIIPGMSKTDRVYKTFSRVFTGVPNLEKR